jgi:hypothetical protein
MDGASPVDTTAPAKLKAAVSIVMADSLTA